MQHRPVFPLEKLVADGAQDMWSNPDIDWSGFEAVEYTLDADRVLGLQLVPHSAAETQPTNMPTTVGGLVKYADERRAETLSAGLPLGGFTATLVTEGGAVDLPCSPFCSQLVSLLLEFRSVDINPFDTSWFWYDSDSVTDDPHDRYAFFVVHRDKIIRERVSFSDYSGNGFDPRIWVADQDSDAIWFSEKGVDDARLRYWYRTFYRETPTGQIMVLRSDEPQLFHYPEGDLLRLLYRSATLEAHDAPDAAWARLVSLMLAK